MKKLKESSPHKQGVEVYSLSDIGFEDIKNKTTKDLESFLLDDLSLNSQESSDVLQIIEDSNKKFKTFISEKRKEFKKQFPALNGYTYDGHDYILLGKNRLEARKRIKNLIGKNKFRSFSQFVNNYNEGKYLKSFVPIEI